MTVVTRGSWGQRTAERPFRRGNLVSAPLIDADRLAQRARQALEAGFDDVVVVLAVNILDVQCDAGGLREGLEPLLEQLGVHFAELRLGEIHLPDQIGPVRAIERDAVQRLVHRDHRMAVAHDAAPLAERLGDGLADDVAGILGGVVEVDVEIAFGAQGDVDQAVARELLEHVIEKTDPGRDIIGTRAVEIDGALDSRFLGLAFDAGLAPGRVAQRVLLRPLSLNWARRDLVARAASARQPDAGQWTPEDLAFQL